MFPPQQGTSLDIEALSGICGSISIACWVVVFSPQIVENFRRQSADGLSVVFLVIWLLGDVFNILGAILQGVLPTMIILAVYYTLADIVLLIQVFYYRGFTFSDQVKKPDDGSLQVDSTHAEEHANDETQPLLPSEGTSPDERRESRSMSQLRKHLTIDGTHLSPATPLLDTTQEEAAQKLKPTSTSHALVSNTFALVLVCGAGVFGWWLSTRNQHHHHRHDTESAEPEPLEFDLWGQIFGYFCAALYLGSRVPQLLLNFRRKSTEGVSLLFFLFACVGNLTYDLSIFAYSPICHVPSHCQPGEVGRLYSRYILINASWIAGSLGTLFLDMAIFVQFFVYQQDDNAEGADVRVIINEERGRDIDAR